MQYKIIKILLFAATVAMVQSCEDAFSKDVIIDVPRQPDRMVIVSNTATGERFSANITRSVDVLAPTNFISINNALVTLFLGSTLIDTLVYNNTNNQYLAKNNSVPIPNATYTIKATLQGLTAAEATIIVPPVIPISSVTYRPKFRVASNGVEQDEIRFSFEDPVAEGNSYLIKVRSPILITNTQVAYNDIFCLFTTDPDAENSLGGLSVGNDDCIEQSFVMKDTRFNGRLKQVTLQVNNFEMGTFTAAGVTYRPIIELQAITPEYYRYYKSQKVYRDAQGNPFAEPVTIYTNVKEGYGIFTAFNRSVRPLQ